MNKKYYGVYSRKEVKTKSGFINAKALGWDTKNWLFSTGKTLKLEAENFVEKVFKIAQSNPSIFDLKRTLKNLKTGEVETQGVYTVENLITDRLETKKISECEL